MPRLVLLFASLALFTAFASGVTLRAEPLGVRLAQTPSEGTNDPAVRNLYLKEAARVWENVRSSTDPVDFEGFIRRFPGTMFADMARERLATLKAPAAAAPAPEQPQASTGVSGVHEKSLRAVLGRDPDGKSEHAVLGVQITGMTHPQTSAFGLTTNEGVLVVDLMAGGPAEVAGFRVLDIITEVAGQKVGDPAQVQNIVKERKVGDHIDIRVTRLGETVAKAVERVRAVARDGNDGASDMLDRVTAGGRLAAEIEPAEAMAVFHAAADKGSSSAMYILARRYALGEGVTTDPSTAARWMYSTLEKGNVGAAYSLTTSEEPWTLEFRQELQRRLYAAGRYTGPFNGVFGPDVDRAITALAEGDQKTSQSDAKPAPDQSQAPPATSPPDAATPPVTRPGPVEPPPGTTAKIQGEWQQYKSAVQNIEKLASDKRYREITDDLVRSLDGLILSLSKELATTLPGSTILFYGLPLSVTGSRTATAESRKWAVKHNDDHWVVNSDNSVFIAWRQETSYFFVVTGDVPGTNEFPETIKRGDLLVEKFTRNPH